MTQRVPILVYHHVYPDDDVGPEGSPARKATGTIGETEFRRHLAHIAESGWSVVSTTQVVEWLAGGGMLPERSAVLHFDNGWLDARTRVMPILREFGMAGTAYVISEGADAATAGRPAAILTSTEGAVQKPCFTWRQAEELLKAGWEIGAHTATHPRLAEVLAGSGGDAVVAEIERSHEAYVENLGFVPAHFAYPSGSRDERTDALLAPYYRSLRLWHFSSPPVWSFTDAGTSPHSLDCQNIDNTVGFDDFARIFVEALDQG